MELAKEKKGGGNKPETLTMIWSGSLYGSGGFGITPVDGIKYRIYGITGTAKPGGLFIAEWEGGVNGHETVIHRSPELKYYLYISSGKLGFSRNGDCAQITAKLVRVD